jgi:hypothetical protein
VPKRGANGGFDSSRAGSSSAGTSRAGPPLTTDEAMNQAFGTSSKEEEHEVEEVGKEEADGGHQDGGQQHDYMFFS